MSLKKVYTTDCYKCANRTLHPGYDDGKTEICIWGKSKRFKKLVEPKGKKKLNCKLIG